MKKYDINSLYVIKIQNKTDTQYFICKYKWYREIYVEVFTNEKIKTDKNSIIEKFSDYYTILAQYNNTDEKQIMIDKKELLKIYIIINGGNLTQYDNNTTVTNKILERATLNFFPKVGSWYSECFEQSQDLNMKYLPCHLRDDLWVSRMLKQNQKLFFLSTDRVLKYVKTSQFFQEKRHNYEQEIVKWQIDWMKRGGANWVVVEKYGGDLIFLSPNCDIGFRKGVVNTLSRIGMNIDAIEEGIEKNADKWRNSFMNSAFSNEYEPYFTSINFDFSFGENENQKEKRKTLEPAEQDFKEKWLQIRRYEYYKRHKNSVDKYGIIEPDTILTENEVIKLRKYLKQKHIERNQRIE